MTKKYYKSDLKYSDNNQCREIVVYQGPKTSHTRNNDNQPNLNVKRCFYEVLGVDRKASNDEIRASYKQLARRYHPDKNNGNEDDNTKFIEAKRAYEVLVDAEKRIIYDKFGMNGLELTEQQGEGWQTNMAQMAENPCWMCLMGCLFLATCCFCCCFCCFCCSCCQTQKTPEQTIITTQPGSGSETEIEVEMIRTTGFSTMEQNSQDY